MAAEPITTTLGVDAELRRRSRDLAERVKELDCLYAISSIMLREELSLGSVFEGALGVIPRAWQYPDITVARIAAAGTARETPGFRVTPWRQASPIGIDEGSPGVVEVCYLEERPDAGEGPFLREERHLIDGIAGLLTQAVRLRRTRQELLASEAMYRSQATLLGAIVAASPLAIIALDTARIVTNWNPGAQRLFGWAPAEVSGRPFPAVPPERTDEADEFWRRLMAGESVVGIETRRARRDGSLADVSFSAAPLRRAGGSVYGAVIVFADLTERKQVEDALRRTSEEVRLLSRGLDDTVIYRYRMEPSPAFEFASHSVSNVTGYTAEEFVADPSLLLTRAHPRDRVLVELAARSPEALPGPLIYRWQRKDGAYIWLELRQLRTAGAQGKADMVEGILRDVTSRVRAESGLKELEARHEALLRTLPVAVFRREAGGAGAIRWASAAAERLTGFSSGRMTQEPGFWLARVHPGDREGVLAEMARAGRSGSATYEYRWRGADDAYHWLLDRAVYVGAEEGGELLVTTEDVTERHGRQTRGGPAYVSARTVSVAGNWRRVALIIPRGEPVPEARPGACPHCGGVVLRRHQVSRRQIAGQLGETEVIRYRCETCRRTFTQRPSGVDRRRYSMGLRALVSLFHDMGLSLDRQRRLLGDSCITIPRTTLWRLADIGGKPAPSGTRYILADEDMPLGSEFVVLERLGTSEDGQFTLDLLLWERQGDAYAWLRERVSQIGASLE